MLIFYDIAARHATSIPGQSRGTKCRPQLDRHCAGDVMYIDRQSIDDVIHRQRQCHVGLVYDDVILKQLGTVAHIDINRKHTYKEMLNITSFTVKPRKYSHPKSNY